MLAPSPAGASRSIYTPDGVVPTPAAEAVIAPPEAPKLSLKERLRNFRQANDLVEKFVRMIPVKGRKNLPAQFCATERIIMSGADPEHGPGIYAAAERADQEHVDQVQIDIKLIADERAAAKQHFFELEEAGRATPRDGFRINRILGAEYAALMKWFAEFEKTGLATREDRRHIDELCVLEVAERPAIKERFAALEKAGLATREDRFFIDQIYATEAAEECKPSWRSCPSRKLSIQMLW